MARELTTMTALTDWETTRLVFTLEVDPNRTRLEIETRRRRTREKYVTCVQIHGRGNLVGGEGLQIRYSRKQSNGRGVAEKRTGRQEGVRFYNVLCTK
jgi:hypothetical protein